MPAQGAHKITAEFEEALCRYTSAPMALAIDNQSNALALCLEYEGVKGVAIEIPNRTYPSVPCEIIHAGGKVKWRMLPPWQSMLSGAYQLAPTRIWDSALRFTADMYLPGQLMCVSFTGAYKHLKLGKGGAILLDDIAAYEWIKRARNSGRGECSYHEDNFTVLGHNYYMMPQVAAQGLLLMTQFYNLDGTKKHMPDLALPYPDLSKFAVYSK